MRIKFYSDPYHGWGAVKKSLLRELGIESKISTYSYMKGQTAYLEEDCDLPRLTAALIARGEAITYEEKHIDRRSPIRSYDSYKV